MPQIIKAVTQSGADTTTTVAIPTGITPDGKMLMRITGAQIFWNDASLVAPAAGFRVRWTLNRTDAMGAFASEAMMLLHEWAVAATATPNGFVAIDPLIQVRPMEPEYTAQPYLYLGVASTASGAANTVVARVQYELVKATDVEVLRMLGAGG